MDVVTLVYFQTKYIYFKPLRTVNAFKNRSEVSKSISKIAFQSLQQNLKGKQ